MGTSQETRKDDLLTVPEAAQRLKLSARQVRRLVAEGRVAHLRLGRSVRFDPADLAVYVASCRVEAGRELAAGGAG